MVAGRVAVGVLALFASLTAATGQTCTETFFTAAAKDPNLGLLTTAVSSLSPSGTSGIIPSPDANITVFAPVDSAFLGLFQTQGLSLASLATLADRLTGVLLQHVVLKPYSAAQLVAAGSVQSSLSELTNASYLITVKETDGNVLVAAKANTSPVPISKSTQVCGSWIHNIEGLLLPTSNISRAPVVSLQAIQAAVASQEAGSSNPTSSGNNAATAAPTGAGPDAATPTAATQTLATADAAPTAAPTPAPTGSATAAAVCTALLPALLLAMALVSA